MRTTITLRHLFNGAATGRETKHRVRSAEGAFRVLAKHGGHGWGAQIWLTRAAAVRLGVRVVYADTVIPCKLAVGEMLPVSVYGHDYSDPEATTL